MQFASTSPFYPLFASLDVGAQMMKGRSGEVLWDDTIRLGIELRKKLRAVRAEFERREQQAREVGESLQQQLQASLAQLQALRTRLALAERQFGVAQRPAAQVDLATQEGGRIGHQLLVVFEQGQHLTLRADLSYRTTPLSV